MPEAHRPGRNVLGTPSPAVAAPELDSAAAEALALVSLSASGSADDAELAARLLTDGVAEPDGAARVARGLISVCAALLALHEYKTGTRPEETLGELGRLVAQAAFDTQPLRH